MPDHRATRVTPPQAVIVQALTASGRAFQHVRNDMPVRPYTYRGAPRQEWAIRALAAAEAAYGVPPEDDTDGACEGCGQDVPIMDRSHGLAVCSGCYYRWRYRKFPASGPGPSAKPRQADSAREHLALITSMSTREAAAVLGRSPRTIQRWRTALQDAS
jgi:hypothetical protein